ncbi:hypothetical protein RYX36_009791 [Vicia faba]
MVRKRRTDGPGGESSDGQHPSERNVPPQQQAAVSGGAGSQGGGGPQGGRGWAPQGGRGGYGGGRGGRGMPQQQYGAPPEYQGRGRGGGHPQPQQQYGAPADYQGRGRGGPPQPQQQYGGPPEYQGRGRGGPSHQGGRGYGGGRGGYGGGVGPGGGHDTVTSYGGPPRPPAPELHQATSVPSASYPVAVSPPPALSEASSSSQPPQVSEVGQDLGQMTIHSEETPAPPPASKSSLRFPLRPGKGSYGKKCVVKANHFFAELPKKDLHQYDVTITPEVTSRGRRQPLGEGLESWRGFYQSIRPTQMGLSLNIDMSSTAFIEPLPVIEFVAQLLNREVSSRPLSDADRVKTKLPSNGGKCCINDLLFAIVLSCLPIAAMLNSTHVMQVCKIVEGQRYSKRLNERQITALLKVTCQRPLDRERDIMQTVHHNAYHEDPYAKEFGIKISEKLAQVEARILPAPWLKYHDTGREKDCLPQVGQWNMMNKKMVNGGTVSNWFCVNFSRNVQDSVARGFCHELAQMCCISGMAFNPDPVVPPVSARPDQVEKVLKTRHHDAKTKLQGKDLDLLIVILPDNNGSLYGDLKRICETDLGVVSQCCLTKHVFKMSKQYLANVSLKINVKVGGRNTVLVDALSRRIPLVSDRPTIIFGADVTHPHPGEDSSPSIAAVVASQDWPEITKYAGLVCAQAHRQELIQDLFKQWQDPVRGTLTGGMIKELLISFRRATGQKPQRIIFYRDGVSEGQFYQVLLFELDAIRKACASLEPNYQPPVTFVVVQKRHHTRLFASNHHDKSSVDRSGNILPGTVVDSKICHPTEFDFYLCSHAGIQGTSRPAHYHVLWDENNFTADALQSLTNNLCYTYARCTRSVSIG